MRITLTRAAGGHAAGDTIDASNGAAQLLIAAGVAQQAGSGQDGAIERNASGHGKASSATGAREAGANKRRRKGGGSPPRSEPLTAG